MSRIIAAVDNSLAAQPVLATAKLLAPILGAEVDAIHIAQNDGTTARASAEALRIGFRQLKGRVFDRIVEEASADDVVGVAVGARGRRAGRHSGHLVAALADV
ncbi:MAG: hypothetical protein ACXVLZ_15540, partial [Acidimicrobiia bacterium]